MPMPRFWGSCQVISSPATRTWPPSTGVSPASARSRVDLPQPEGPIKAVTWPLGIFMLTLNSACLLP